MTHYTTLYDVSDQQYEYTLATTRIVVFNYYLLQ